MLLYIGSLSKVFGDRRSKVMFANLFDELAEHFPKDQMIRLQDLIYSTIVLFHIFIVKYLLIFG